MPFRVSALCFASLLAAVMLGGCRPEDRAAPPPPEPVELEPLDPDRVLGDPGPPNVGSRGEVRTVEAFHSDREFANGEGRIPARRVVYRMSLYIPRGMGAGDPAIQPSSAELYIDVSASRLRARFVGDGWPVENGSEVRIRRDHSGVYLFDGDGGRPLAAGQLVNWFEGGQPRRNPTWRVRAPVVRTEGPGDLICRLIAEWTGERPGSVARRCGEGGSTSSFRVGLWRGRRTADVAIELDREDLRADEEAPPDRIVSMTGGQLVRDSTMPRLRRARGVRPEVSPDAPDEGLIFVNRSPATMVVTVDGVPVVWLDSHTTFHSRQFPAGVYEIGAVRAFGLQAATVRHVTVPGRVTLPR